MTRRFQIQKLVRDKIPLLNQQQNAKSKLHVLNDVEFDRELKAKLLEESLEIQKSDGREELVEEIADLYDVLQTLMQLHGISNEAIQEMLLEKHEERGAFAKRLFAEYVDIEDGSPLLDYVLKKPEKYPEISEK